jgi:Mrp family chromosome partitioning ATPase
LKALLARWREEFDTVIVATSPWSSNQDSALVAPLVDCTVLVTNGQRVRKRLALGQIGAIRRVGGRVLGLVITQTRRDDPAAVVAASDDLALVTPTTEPNTTTP